MHILEMFLFSLVLTLIIETIVAWVFGEMGYSKTDCPGGGCKSVVILQRVVAAVDLNHR